MDRSLIWEEALRNLRFVNLPDPLQLPGFSLMKLDWYPGMFVMDDLIHSLSNIKHLMEERGYAREQYIVISQYGKLDVRMITIEELVFLKLQGCNL